MEKLLLSLTSSLRVIWACMRKEIQTALAEPRPTLLGALRPVLLLVLISLIAVGGGLDPTAVVMNDTGPYAHGLRNEMPICLRRLHKLIECCRFFSGERSNYLCLMKTEEPSKVHSSHLPGVLHLVAQPVGSSFPTRRDPGALGR